jgi:hypothetical protein
MSGFASETWVSCPKCGCLLPFGTEHKLCPLRWAGVTMSDDNYIAWMHWTGPTEHMRLSMCDSDSSGAFKVYRHADERAEKAEAAIASWKQEEAIWKETEARLLARVERLESNRQEILRQFTLNEELMEARVAEMERALREISELHGKCIYSLDPGFREGSASAWCQTAEIADDALAPKPKEATDAE